MVQQTTELDPIRDVGGQGTGTGTTAVTVDLPGPSSKDKAWILEQAGAIGVDPTPAGGIFDSVLSGFFIVPNIPQTSPPNDPANTGTAPADIGVPRYLPLATVTDTDTGGAVAYISFGAKGPILIPYGYNLRAIWQTYNGGAPSAAATFNVRAFFREITICSQ